MSRINYIGRELKKRRKLARISAADLVRAGLTYPTIRAIESERGQWSSVSLYRYLEAIDAVLVVSKQPRDAIRSFWEDVLAGRKPQIDPKKDEKDEEHNVV